MIEQLDHDLFKLSFDNGKVATIKIGKEFQVFVNDDEEEFEEVFYDAEDFIDFLNNLKDGDIDEDLEEGKCVFKDDEELDGFSIADETMDF